jgi:predicted nuclease with TOPRIM domain
MKNQDDVYSVEKIINAYVKKNKILECKLKESEQVVQDTTGKLQSIEDKFRKTSESNRDMSVCVNKLKEDVDILRRENNKLESRYDEIHSLHDRIGQLTVSKNVIEDKYKVDTDKLKKERNELYVGILACSVSFENNSVDHGKRYLNNIFDIECEGTNPPVIKVILKKGVFDKSIRVFDSMKGDSELDLL